MSNDSDSIQVINHSEGTMKVAINKWENGGNGGHYSVSVNERESWERPSSYGYIMNIENGRFEGSWYVKTGSILKFGEGGKWEYTKGFAQKM